MAIAAYWMTVATWVHVALAVIGTGVAIVGTILLLRSLRYSRDATKAAARAAEAAIESNRINRENFIASERPRVIVDSIAATGPIEWGENQAMLKFVVRLTNIGHTPAVAADLRVEMVLHQPDAKSAYERIRATIKEDGLERGFIIGGPGEFFMQYTMNITKKMVHMYATKLASAHGPEEFDRRYKRATVFPILVGCVAYATVIDERHYFSGFIARVSGRGPDGKVCHVGPNVGSIPVENVRVTMYPIGKLIAE